ncbi:hypothetical protein [Paraburkholderia terricola]|uniref:hypothetical protein n=1 Tax=Paraburkholderia terricola TaxID=169427 RepID=UPI001FC965EF|nr:hypothetical protein [Paraburkholderia terricola]
MDHLMKSDLHDLDILTCHPRAVRQFTYRLHAEVQMLSCAGKAVMPDEFPLARRSIACSARSPAGT